MGQFQPCANTIPFQPRIDKWDSSNPVPTLFRFRQGLTNGTVPTLCQHYSVSDKDSPMGQFQPCANTIMVRTWIDQATVQSCANTILFQTRIDQWDSSNPVPTRFIVRTDVEKPNICFPLRSYWDRENPVMK